MTAHLQLVQPNNENRSVRTQRRIPTRPSNSDLRPREYLTPSEVETLTSAARKGRYGHRDATLILVAYRHGLRAVEICDLEWSQLEFDRAATLHVRRAKNGKPAAHPIRGDELRALRELQRHTGGGYVFETERGAPFTTDAVNRLIKRIGERTGLPFKVHIHMLRHACGYALGHRAIQHTARYTELSQERFKDFWRT